MGARPSRLTTLPGSTGPTSARIFRVTVATSLSAYDPAVVLDFLIFGVTLACVAIFHRHTLAVALTGLGAIIVKKLLWDGFDEGAGFSALFAHFAHEWVLLAILFRLLLGFALLTRHFEASRIPDWMPVILPDDWRGAFVLLVLIFVTSSFLDNIAGALIGATVAGHVFKRRVRVGYLAAIVAAANAGGAGSVIGDTTTTMLWIGGVSPFSMLNAYVFGGRCATCLRHPGLARPTQTRPYRQGCAAGPAHLLSLRCGRHLGARGGDRRQCRCPFARRAYSRSDSSDRARGRRDPYPGCSLRSPRFVGYPWSGARRALSSRRRLRRIDDAGQILAGAKLGDDIRIGLPLGGIRQHSADCSRHEAGQLRLGSTGLCRRLRRFDDLVRIVGGRRGCGAEARGAVFGPLAPRGMVRARRLRGRILPHARAPRLESREYCL